MITATPPKANFVEVELGMDIVWNKPTTDENGELAFCEYRPPINNLFGIKCKVPKEVLANGDTLEKYVREKMLTLYEAVSLDYVCIL